MCPRSANKGKMITLSFRDKSLQFLIITELIGGRRGISLPKAFDTVPYNKLIRETLTTVQQQVRSWPWDHCQVRVITSHCQTKRLYFTGFAGTTPSSAISGFCSLNLKMVQSWNGVTTYLGTRAQSDPKLQKLLWRSLMGHSQVKDFRTINSLEIRVLRRDWKNLNSLLNLPKAS